MSRPEEGDIKHENLKNKKKFKKELSAEQQEKIKIQTYRGVFSMPLKETLREQYASLTFPY